MWRTIKSYIFNGLAHYNVRNRIEYIRLLLRVSDVPIVKQRLAKRVNYIYTYVISINSHFERRQFMSSQLDSQKINFVFVDATVGKNIGEYYNFISDKSLKYLTEGSVGCWISHLRVWQMVARGENGYYIILEDDVNLFENFLQNIKCSLTKVSNDFDILFLGTGNNYKHNRRFIINNEIFVPYQLRNGAYSYILTPNGARKLIELIPNVKVARGGIDSAIGALIRDCKILAYHLIIPVCQVDYSFGSFTKSRKNGIL
ncbi:MAG: glycosyltransferase family 25 protein [Janthinobacterium lividum]